jgi:CRISPR-associated protein Csm1
MPKNKVEAEKKEQFSLGQWLIEFPKLKRCWLLSNNVEPVLGADLCLRIANHKNPEISFLSNNKTTSQGFEFLADAVATEKNETGRKQIVEFHKLAGKAKEAGAAEFLGVLRMDVDSLGYVFAKGFTEEKDKSIAKVANLSRMLDMFFTGYLNTLVDNHNLYITYAGGDDLFIVGAWNEVIDLAETINEKFKAYCGNNPSLHISGAVALCKGKYPIGRAAEESGELLDNKAKNLKYKNALAFMNKAIAWDDWPAVKDTAKKIIEGLEKGTVSRSFIYNLLALYNQYIDVSSRDQKKNTTAHLLLVPKFLYSLVRNVTDKNLCIELETMIHKQQAYLSVIAGYAALKTRSNSEKEKLKGVNDEQLSPK